MRTYEKKGGKASHVCEGWKRGVKLAVEREKTENQRAPRVFMFDSKGGKRLLYDIKKVASCKYC